MRTRRSLGIRLMSIASLTVAAFLLAACGDDGPVASAPLTASPAPERGKVTVVQAGFTESDLVAQAYAAILDTYGYEVTVKTMANREAYAPKLADGTVDLVPDYLGSAADYYSAQQTGDADATVATSDVAATLAELKKLTAPSGLTVLTPSAASDRNAFAVTEEFATANGLTTLSDLGASGTPVVVAAPKDCASRPLCGGALTSTYGVDVTRYVPFAFGSKAAKAQVTDGKAQLVLVSTTDGTLFQDRLVILGDDKRVQPAENLVPIVGKGSPLLRDQEVLAVFEQFSQGLTDAELILMNQQVEVERVKTSDAAKGYLQKEGLI